MKEEDATIDAIARIRIKIIDDEDFKREKWDKSDLIGRIRVKHEDGELKYFRYNEDLDDFEEYQPDEEELDEIQETLEDALSATKADRIQDPVAKFEQKKKALQKNIVVMKPETAKKIILACLAIFILSFIAIELSKVVTNARWDYENYKVTKQKQEEDKIKSKGPKVELTSFANMNSQEISKWCDQNKVKLKLEEEYSDTVPKGQFISQNIQAGQNVVQDWQEVVVTVSKGKQPTQRELEAQKQGLQCAMDDDLSAKGTYKKLISLGYTPQEAQYAIDNINIYWGGHAWGKAKEYKKMNWSKEKAYEQLVSENGDAFTPQEAQDAVRVVYD